MVDISGLETKDNADAGIWFTVRLYGEEQDFQLKILGDDSDAVSRHLKDRIRKIANRPERKRFDDEDIEDAAAMDKENILVRVVGVRGVKRDKRGKIISYDETVSYKDRILKDDPADYAFLLEKIPEIKTFVSKVSLDRTNFLSGGKKN
jgi:hypothetical protein